MSKSFSTRGASSSNEAPNVTGENAMPYSKKDIGNYQLPDSLVDAYRQKKLNALYDWQAECLHCDANVLLGNKNLLYCAPTSGGKTLVSEVLMFRKVHLSKKKSFFILPYVSVVTEKEESLKKLLKNTNMNVAPFYGGSSSRVDDPFDIGVCTIEKANALVNALVEQGSGVLSETLCMIVLDELHLLGDSSRGYLLELLVSKVLYYAPDVQLVGMSATLPNVRDVARWMRAAFFETFWRPVPLKEMVLDSYSLFCAKTGEEIRQLSVLPQKFNNVEPHHEHYKMFASIIESFRTENKPSVLVFCSSKMKCEKLSDWTAERMPNEDTDRRKDMVIALKHVGLDATLSRTVPKGIAFHHAGLTVEERRIVETGFREGDISVLFATSTLAAGVNLPARRVIFESPFIGRDLLAVSQYRQMCGRAGRAGQGGTFGESIMICKGVSKSKVFGLIKADMKPLKSCLHGDARGLSRLLLEMLCVGARDKNAKRGVHGDSIIDLASCTLLSVQKASDQTLSVSALEQLSVQERFPEIYNAMQVLMKFDMIRSKQGDGGKRNPTEIPESCKKTDSQQSDSNNEAAYVATPLGRAVCAAGMSPDQGYDVWHDLQNMRKEMVLETDLQLCFLVTPRSGGARSNDVSWDVFLELLTRRFSSAEKRVADLIGIRESFVSSALTQGVPQKRANSPEGQRHIRFFSALLLWALVRETPLTLIERKFRIGRGPVQQLRESASSTCAIMATFCQKLRWGSIESLLLAFQSRLNFGVACTELIPLMQIAGMSPNVARMLHNNGFTTPVMISSAQPDELLRILRKTLPSGAPSSSIDLSIAEKLKAKSREAASAKRKELIQQAQNISLRNKHNARNKSPDIHKRRRIDDQMPAKENLAKSNFTSGASTSTTTSLLSIPESCAIAAEFPKAPPKFGAQVPVARSLQQPFVSKSDSVSVPRGPLPKSTQPLSNSAKLLAFVPASASGAIQQPSSVVLPPSRPFVPVHNPNSQVSTSSVSTTNCSVRPPLFSPPTRPAPSIFTQQSPSGTVGHVEHSLPKAVQRFSDPGVHERKETGTLQIMRQQSLPGKPHPTAGSIGATRPAIRGEFKDGLRRLGRRSITAKDRDAVSMSCDIQLRSSAPSRLSAPSRTVGERWLPVMPSNVKQRIRWSEFCHNTDMTNYRQTKFLEAVNNSTNLLQQALQKSDVISMIVSQNCGECECVVCTPRQNEKVLFWNTKHDEFLPDHLISWVRISSNIIVTDDAKELCKFFISKGVDVLCNCADLNIAHWLLEPESKREFTVETLCQIYSADVPNISIIQQSSLAQPGFDYKRLSWEVVAAFSIMIVIYQRLECASLTEPFWKLEMPICPILAYMEYWGIGIHPQHIQHPTRVVAYKIMALEEAARQLLDGNRLSLRSAEQCGRVLFEDLQIPVPNGVTFKRKANGRIAYTSNAEILKQIGGVHPLVDIIVEFRRLASVFPKLRSIPDHGSEPLYSVDPLNGNYGAGKVSRVRCEFKQNATATGRLSCCNPNLLAIENSMEVTDVSRPSLHDEFSFDNKQSVIVEEETKVLAQCCADKNLMLEGLLISIETSTLEDPYDNNARESLGAYWSRKGFPYSRERAREVHQVRIKFGNDQLFSFPADQVYRQAAPVSIEANNTKIRVALRDLFVPEPSWVLLAVDYSQLEVRLMAHFSGDQNLTQILFSEGDVFQAIASSWLDKPMETVTAEERSGAKRVCYGLLYGIGDRALAAELGISLTQTQDFVKSFNAQFPKVAQFIEQCKRSAAQSGYVVTLLGRHRALPQIASRNVAERKRAERQAVNSVCQASAADLVKCSMIRIFRRLRAESSESLLSARLLLQIHDELLFEVHPNHLERVQQLVIQEMENAFPLNVPLKVKTKTGSSWGTLK